jgi:hypothetical protein
VEYLHIQPGDSGLGWKAPANQMRAHIHRRHQQTHIDLETLQRHLLVRRLGGEQSDVALLHADLLVLGGDDVS